MTETAARTTSGLARFLSGATRIYVLGVGIAGGLAIREKACHKIGAHSAESGDC
jgi:hypothetical protein